VHEVFLSHSRMPCNHILTRAPSFATTRTPQIDPLDHQRKLRRFHLHVTRSRPGSPRQMKPSPLQALVDQQVAARFPEKDLQTVRSTVDEGKEMT